MAKTAIPLQDLAKRIRQQQAELEKLRQEYQVRQAHLSDLTRHKEELQAQLRQVEAEMQGLDKGVTPAAKPAPAKAGKKPTSGVSLSQFLIQTVTDAGRPVTAKELATEVVRRKFPTTSHNIPGLIDTQVSLLVKKGLLQRAQDQAGVLPAQPLPKRAAPAAKPKPATAPPPAVAESGLSLRAMVTKVLAQSAHPLSARELAEKVLASGYQTKSKDFTNVIWGGVGQMPNVENVPGQGYRLKKDKGSK